MFVEAAPTANQQKVLDTLQQAGVPLSAYGILERSKESSIRAPLQV